MKNALFSRILSVIVTAALLAPAGSGAAFAQGGCWDNSTIQAALAEGRIQPVASVLAREGISPSTQVLNVRVCEQGGGLVYVLAVLESSGEARNLTLNAQ
ncbi:hypothetical protein [Pelagibacterium lentulum]|uniref:PepSY domain-containing protein n=1 Tax=Pelagibacterium lentulum TaxID=2029865 RepID=A0A916RHQ0_9HYPH|nr:hypothetical protein [Pelagibacterium lentulum]GGA54187.1 hypothetical protein GCM10011499_25430 [Pelagibacterium lentulum]